MSLADTSCDGATSTIGPECQTLFTPGRIAKYSYILSDYLRRSVDVQRSSRLRCRANATCSPLFVKGKAAENTPLGHEVYSKQL